MSNARRHYQIVEEPVGAVYRGLILYLSHLCPLGLFTLPDSPPPSPLVTDVLGLLKEHVVEFRRSMTFPGNWSKNAQLQLHESFSDDAPAIYVFRLNGHSLFALLGFTEGLYDWEYPDLPENLCLMRPEKQACLCSVTRERMAYLYMTEDEVRTLLRRIPQVRVERVPEDEEWEEPFWWADSP